MDSPGTLFSMAKVLRRKTARQPTRRVWRRIYLEAWRDKRGLSVEGLAEKAGVSPGLISLIENSKSGGSPETLEKLAKALDCEVGELLDVKPDADGSMLRVWVDDENRATIERILAAFPKSKG